MKPYKLLLIFALMLAWVTISAQNRETGKNENAIEFIVRTPLFDDAVYNINDFGAVGDGVSNETQSIQKTIDYCASQNGGTVLVPPGVYLSGTLFLQSNIRLHIEKGAILLGSDKLEDFPETIPETRSFTDNYTSRSLIYAEGKHNIAITGEGIINGQGAKYIRTRDHDKYILRPYLIRIVNCRYVLTEGITLLNSPMWVQHYLASDHVTIRNITVKSRYANYNNDGIDIDGCHFVRITDCDINCEDDAIVLKSTLNRRCENITIDNCRISSLANAFKCGTESNGGFYNIIFTNSYIYNTDNSGIALEIVDGGHLNQVFISDITMSNVSNPIFIRLGNRARPFISGDPPPPVGSLKNVTIRNIEAINVQNYTEKHTFRTFSDDVKPHLPSSISGMPSHPVENIFFENIFIQSYGGFSGNPNELIPVPENESSYPEFSMFGQLPASGFYIRNARNIHFNNVVTETLNPDKRINYYNDSNTSQIFRDGKLISECTGIQR